MPKYRRFPSKKHIWCSGCSDKVSGLWNLRCFDHSEGKEIMLCELCIMHTLGNEVARLRAHRCEVGLEDPDAMLAHLQTLPPEEIESINHLFKR